MPTLDDLLAALPDVGLWLWMLDQSPAGWTAQLYDPQNPLARWEAVAATPGGAVAEALKAAGVQIGENE